MPSSSPSKEEVRTPSPSPSASPSTVAPQSTRQQTPLKSYSVESLKGIESQCRGRLPPASAVQAMLLYELQRESETEKLFHAQMFQLAQDETARLDQERRIKDLETRLKKMEEQTATRDQLRVSTTSTAKLIQAQQGKLNECIARLDEVEKKLGEVEEQLQILRETTSATATVASEAGTAATVASTAVAELAAPLPKSAELAMMKEELNVLFDDRDGVLRMVDEITSRVDVLQGSVRALTLQKSSSVSCQISQAPSQRLPLRTSNGTLLDLSIPKGSPLVALGRENRAPSPK